MALNRSAIRAAVVVALASALCSCGAYRVVGPADPRLAPQPADGRRIRVAGYTTTDGRRHAFDGYLIVAGDSLLLTHSPVPGSGSMAAWPERVIALSRDEVLSVKLDEGVSVPRTVLAGMLVVATGVLVALAVLAAVIPPF